MLKPGTIKKVGGYYQNSFEFTGDLLRAKGEFSMGMGHMAFSSSKSEGFFNEWFLYDFVLSNGLTPLQDFVKNNPLNLKDDEMHFYKVLLENNHYSLYEILDIKIGRQLKLRDTFTNKEYDVLEHMGTYEAKKGAVTFGRVAKTLDHYELVGADTLMLDIKTKKDIDQIVKNLKQLDLPLTPMSANLIWLANNMRK